MTAPVEIWGAGETETTRDGITLRPEKLAEGLSSPVAAVFADDGTLFIAERTGTIKVFAEGRPELSEALRLGTGAEDPAPQILSIALDPKYRAKPSGFCRSGGSGAARDDAAAGAISRGRRSPGGARGPLRNHGAGSASRGIGCHAIRTG